MTDLTKRAEAYLAWHETCRQSDDPLARRVANAKSVRWDDSDPDMQAEAAAIIREQAQRIAELEAESARLRADAGRYQWLCNKARQQTAYDIYGDGAHWSIGLHSEDRNNTFAAAIDAAIKQERS